MSRHLGIPTALTACLDGSDVYPPAAAIVGRGFVREVRCTLAAFVGDGTTPGLAAAIFASQPVTRVVLTDREPHRGPGGMFGWDFRMAGLPDRPGDLPVELWRKLLPYRPDEQVDEHGWYDTRQAALDALSAACVAYGRGLAGMGPLPSGQPGGGS